MVYWRWWVRVSRRAHTPLVILDINSMAARETVVPAARMVWALFLNEDRILYGVDDGPGFVQVFGLSLQADTVRELFRWRRGRMTAPPYLAGGRLVAADGRWVRVFTSAELIPQTKEIRAGASPGHEVRNHRRARRLQPRPHHQGGGGADLPDHLAYAFDDTQHGADLFDLKVAGNIYTRIMNPTTAVLEQRLAELEGGIGALAVASGMAAITYAIQTIAEAGDNIVSSSTLYGGTYNLFAHTFPQLGIEVRFADPRDPAAFAALIDERTKAVYCESIGNPLGNITDIRRWPMSPTPPACR
jgi:hypothetical protein